MTKVGSAGRVTFLTWGCPVNDGHQREIVVWEERQGAVTKRRIGRSVETAFLVKKMQL